MRACVVACVRACERTRAHTCVMTLATLECIHILRINKKARVYRITTLLGESIYMASSSFLHSLPLLTNLHYHPPDKALALRYVLLVNNYCLNKIILACHFSLCHSHFPV